MKPVLNSYLVQHKNLSIPGLGTIWIDWEPASGPAEKDRWLPPVPVYRFDKFHDTPGKDFFQFVAEQKKIPEHEAMKWYSEYAAALRSEVRTKEEVRWEGLMVFRKGAAGEIAVEPVDQAFQLFAPIEVAEISRTTAVEPTIMQEEAALPVVTSDGEEQLSPLEAKRAWWIFALVLLVAILLFLFIHFYRKGMVWQSLFNQQPVF